MGCKGLPGFLYQIERRGREQDSGETERQRDRESVCVRGRALRQEKDSVGNKTDL